MTDQATPNLPSRDFEVTERFYVALGFERGFRDDGWMILQRGKLTLEFFPFPTLDPATSNFSCCLRVDDLAGFHAVCKAADLEEKTTGWPRLHPARETGPIVMASLIDPDGTLLRLIQN